MLAMPRGMGHEALVELPVPAQVPVENPGSQQRRQAQGTPEPIKSP